MNGPRFDFLYRNVDSVLFKNYDYFIATFGLFS